VLLCAVIAVVIMYSLCDAGFSFSDAVFPLCDAVLSFCDARFPFCGAVFSFSDAVDCFAGLLGSFVVLLNASGRSRLIRSRRCAREGIG
jgi:hypothetical protein